MFENLSNRLSNIFQDLRRRGKLSAEDVDTVLRSVRMALLEADVHYSVVKDFTNRIRERAVGQEVSKALNPAQQVIKIVHEELIATLGEPDRLNLTGEKPRVIMLVGLQGSGKTTASAKLGKYLRAKGERVLLVGADPYRPAAADQLRTLGEQISIPVFHEADKKVPQMVRRAYDHAKKGGFGVMIVDTAGRSQLDQELMVELKAIAKNITISETLLVVDAMIGQEALAIAEGFRDAVQISGLIFSKMDGDARGGAAISIRSVTGVPIKFIGTGESVDALESFDSNRLASRILGMGDILGLIEKAEINYSQEEAEKQTEKMLSGRLNLEDYIDQIRQVRKMGSVDQLLSMMPGEMNRMTQQVDPIQADRQLNRTEAIILSMTRAERKSPDLLNASRRRRIAAGSGTTVQDVNRLLKQFKEMQKMMKMIKKTGGKGLSRMFK
ncbi:MAG: signal recognition particle protein [Anaerolineaceae bacterium]|nr:signal recognition particle protein [Anaerolineaceae bacterium]